MGHFSPAEEWMSSTLQSLGEYQKCLWCPDFQSILKYEAFKYISQNKKCNHHQNCFISLSTPFFSPPFFCNTKIHKSIVMFMWIFASWTHSCSYCLDQENTGLLRSTLCPGFSHLSPMGNLISMCNTMVSFDYCWTSFKWSLCEFFWDWLPSLSFHDETHPCCSMLLRLVHSQCCIVFHYFSTPVYPFFWRQVFG